VGLCINIGGFPILGDSDCADKYRNDRNKKKKIKGDDKTDRIEARGGRGALESTLDGAGRAVAAPFGAIFGKDGVNVAGAAQGALAGASLGPLGAVAGGVLGAFGSVGSAVTGSSATDTASVVVGVGVAAVGAGAVYYLVTNK
jgi:hypothetical protein